MEEFILPTSEAMLDGMTHLVSERALHGETLLLNMGPQHPSTHGVLRLLLELDGEKVVKVIPDIGFLHTGIEKNMEAKTYLKAEVMTDRLDYLNTMGNNLVYVMAIEKLCELDVPPRAQTIRLIFVELQRIASHLVWLGTHALDLAAMSVFLYCFRERELILDIMEMCSGQRMMTTYFRPGGLWRDVPAGFEDAVREFIKIFPARLEQYEALLTRNLLFLERVKGLGVLSKENALRWAVTGPMLRASGVNYDLRKEKPYLDYDQYDFDVPTHTDGDTYARYLVRMQEMRQSLRIISQALQRMPDGNEFKTQVPRLIRPPAGEVYSHIESPRGELGFYIVSDTSIAPYRYHVRGPSFINLTALRDMIVGWKIAAPAAASFSTRTRPSTTRTRPSANQPSTCG